MWLFKKISQAVSGVDKFKHEQLGAVFDVGKGGFDKKKDGYRYKKWYQPFWSEPKKRSVYYSSHTLEELAAKAGITEAPSNDSEKTNAISDSTTETSSNDSEIADADATEQSELQRTAKTSLEQEQAIDELKAKDNDSQLYKGILSALQSCVKYKEYRRVELEILIKLTAEYIEKRKGFKLTKQGNYRLAFAKAVYSVAFREHERLLAREAKDIDELSELVPTSIHNEPLMKVYSDMVDLIELKKLLDEFERYITAVETSINDFKPDNKNAKASKELTQKMNFLKSLSTSNDDYKQKLEELSNGVEDLQSQSLLYEKLEYRNKLARVNASVSALYIYIFNSYADNIVKSVNALYYCEDLTKDEQYMQFKAFEEFKKTISSKYNTQNALESLNDWDNTIGKVQSILENKNSKYVDKITQLKAAVDKLRNYINTLNKVKDAVDKLSSLETFSGEALSEITQLENAVAELNLDEVAIPSVNALKENIAKLREYANKPAKIKEDIAALRNINPLENEFKVALKNIATDIDQIQLGDTWRDKHSNDIQTLKDNVAELKNSDWSYENFKAKLKTLQKNFIALYHVTFPRDPLKSKSEAMLGININQRDYKENSWGLEDRGLLYNSFSSKKTKKAEVINAHREYLLYSAKHACIAHIQRNSFAAARVALRVYFSYVLASGNIPEAYPENEKLMLDLRKAEQGYVVDMKELETILEGNPSKDKIIAHRNEAIQRRDYVDKDALLKLANRLPTTYDTNGNNWSLHL